MCFVLFGYLTLLFIFLEEALGFTTKRRSRLRRSAVGNIEKARSRTLKMTLVIGNYFHITIQNTL